MWADRFPLVSPVSRSRNRKSAASRGWSRARIISRDGSWITLSRLASSLKPPAMATPPPLGRWSAGNPHGDGSCQDGDPEPPLGASAGAPVAHVAGARVGELRLGEVHERTQY